MQSLISRAVVTKVVGFAQVSGIGLGLDVGLFLLLVAGAWPPGFANLISASMAVTFVYFVSTKHIFEYKGRFLLHLFAIYLTYQVVAVASASWAVAELVELGIIPIVSKGLILPLTFSANYLFLDFLTKVGR